MTGMQDIDKQTSQALLEFSYHLAIGDTNEAYKVTNMQSRLRAESRFTICQLYSCVGQYNGHCRIAVIMNKMCH